MTGITTHVLDTSNGVAANGIKVRLHFRNLNGEYDEIGTG